MDHDIQSGVIMGLLIVIAMKNVPLFHGFDSNDVRRIVFEDDIGKYMLIPKRIEGCGYTNDIK